MKFAIPSYNRRLQLEEKTLNTLRRHKIPDNQIDIFVVAEELEEYKKIKGDYNFICGVKGLKEIREFIFDYYDEGFKFVSMDDDIEKIKMKSPRSWEASCFEDCEIDLMFVIDTAFNECLKSNRKLWGLYPVDNHFFMKNDITYDYKFIIGNFFGVINDKECNKLGTAQYDDYERCIKHYLKYGGGVRLNYLCCKTKYLNPKGGMGVVRNYEEAQNYLLNTYPNLLYLKKKKDGLNPVLKDKRSKN